VVTIFQELYCSINKFQQKSSTDENNQLEFTLIHQYLLSKIHKILSEVSIFKAGINEFIVKIVFVSPLCLMFL
jgi:hypothetical protein